MCHSATAGQDPGESVGEPNLVKANSESKSKTPHSLPRMDQMLGDELSRSLLDLTTSGNLRASPAHNASYSAAGFPQGKNMLVICKVLYTGSVIVVSVSS